MPKKPRDQGSPRRQKPEPFNAPFRGLRTPTEKRAPPERARPAPAPAPPTASDDDLFRDAVRGATPLEDAPRAPRARKPPVARQPAVDEDGEALARLADLCAGIGPFDFADTSEYIEGSAPGIDHRLVRRLRKGEFSVQSHLDLHGMNREEARLAVERHLIQARARGQRCVLLIHGRGHNSKDHVPVLKQLLGGWLRRGRLGRLVLAFATALPHDGGAGALYVLLRR